MNFLKLLLVALLLSTAYMANAQKQVVIFTASGENFNVYLNGKKQNARPDSRFVFNDLQGERYRGRIDFIKKGIPSINKTILAKRGKKMTYVISGKSSGGHVMRLKSETSIHGKNTKGKVSGKKSRNATKSDVKANTRHNKSEKVSRTKNQRKSNNVKSSRSKKKQAIVKAEGDSQTKKVKKTKSNTKASGTVKRSGTKSDRKITGKPTKSKANAKASGTVKRGKTKSNRKITGSATKSNSDAKASGTVKRSGTKSNRKITGKPTKSRSDKRASGTVKGGSNKSAACMISPREFSNAQKSIQGKSYDQSKLTIAKQITNNHCFTARQIQKVMGLFDYENTRLEYAKYAYMKCHDQNNYYIVNDAFEYESSIKKLDEYIKSRGF